MNPAPSSSAADRTPSRESLAPLSGSASYDVWEDGTSNAEHLDKCDGCERCDWLIDGFYMACDHCGHWGMQSSDGWTLCHGMVFCNARCRDGYFGCDASGFSETEPLHSPQNDQTQAPL
jgi:hypothetical protein